MIDPKNYFCDLSCGIEHTVCQRAVLFLTTRNKELNFYIFQPCTQSSLCGASYEKLEMTDKLRIKILNMHNEFRLAVAEGVYTQIPEGSNIHVLVRQKNAYIKYVLNLVI